MAVCSLFLYEALEAFQDTSAQKRHPAQNLAQVVTRTAQQGIHGVTLGVFEEVSSQPSIRFHVPNHRLYRIATLELLLAVTPRLAPAIHTLSLSKGMP